MTESTQSLAGILNSWKEIAAYLGRGIRTVQRWERDLSLPVHRIGKGKRSPVFAMPRELNFWLAMVDSDRRSTFTQLEIAPISEAEGELRMSIRNLSHLVAEASELQRRRVEPAKERRNQPKLRIKRAS